MAVLREQTLPTAFAGTEVAETTHVYSVHPQQELQVSVVLNMTHGAHHIVSLIRTHQKPCSALPLACCEH